jgi:hypothetical protein
MSAFVGVQYSVNISCFSQWILWYHVSFSWIMYPVNRMNSTTIDGKHGNASNQSSYKRQ